MIKTIFGIVLFGYSLIALAGEEKGILVDPQQTNFVVSLEANPTTGYQWTVVHYNKQLLSLGRSQYQKAKSNLIGAGGRMLFTFNLKKGVKYPAETDLVFKYARAWEPQSSTIKTVSVQFKKL